MDYHFYFILYKFLDTERLLENFFENQGQVSRSLCSYIVLISARRHFDTTRLYESKLKRMI